MANERMQALLRPNGQRMTCERFARRPRLSLNVFVSTPGA
jgi:hypothetical protein